MKSSTANIETSINEEVFHEVSESFQKESSSSSLNDAVQQSPKEVILPSLNTRSIPINMVPNGDEASTSHNVFNERLEDAYFDASTSFHDPSNVQTFYQPYPHEKKWTMDHPLHRIIGDPKSSVRTRDHIRRITRLRRIQDHCLTLKNTLKFWCTAIAFDPSPPEDNSKAHPCKVFKIKFTVMNGQRSLTLDYKTYCEATGLDYNQGNYVAHPSLEVVKVELAKIATNKALIQKNPIIKTSFPMAWRILLTFVVYVLGENYSSTEVLNSI
nr:hypothetical protein [Tanacetum cinerariifolium]